MKITPFGLVALLVGSFLAASPCAQTGGETSCNGQNLLVEHWPDYPQPPTDNCHIPTYKNLQFVITMGSTFGAGLRFLPNFPVANCPLCSVDSTSKVDPCFLDTQQLSDLVHSPVNPLDPQKIPGIQSVIRAASHWNDVLESDAGFDLKPYFTGSGPVLTTACSSPSSVPFTSVSGYSSFASWAPFVLAQTPVELDLTSAGVILDADLLLNPSLAWYEFNDFQQQGYVNVWDDQTGATTNDSWTDLEGVLTHEFGHVLGVPHSLIDSVTGGGMNPSSSPALFPTMFPTAQYSVLGPTPTLAGVTGHAQGVDYGICNQAFVTVSGELLGWTARTLEASDRNTLGRLYPSASFASTHGNISGVVRRDGIDGVLPGTGAPGAHVVALAASDPLAGRYEALSLTDGEYNLTGLPPGSYYVYVEPVDYNVGAAATSSAYFTFDSLPSWLQLAKDCHNTSLVQPDSFPIDFWNGAGELFNENHKFAEFSTVQVTAGSSAVADFRIATGSSAATDLLKVQRANVTVPTSPFTARGVQATFDQFGGALAAQAIRYKIEDPTRKGSLVAVYMSSSPIVLASYGQLALAFNPGANPLNGLPISGVPAPFQSLNGAVIPGIPFMGVLDATNGAVTFNHPALGNHGEQALCRYHNVYVQAMIFDFDASNHVINPVLTNVINVWFFR